MYESFISLLAISTLLFLINAKLLKLPTTIGLMILGMVFSLILVGLRYFLPSFYASIPHLLEVINFHDFVMDVLLGFLLFAGAVHINVMELKKEKITVFVFAIIGTLISTFVVGYLSFSVFNFIGIQIPLMYCLLFGALISPTDPIAVISVLKNYQVKTSLTMKIEGESLFNDGIGIVIFITILNLVNSGSDTFDIGSVAVLFLKEAVGGIVFGLAIGWIAVYLLKNIISLPKFAVLTTLVVASLGYSLANLMEVSGALAMVAAGLVIGNWLHTASSEDINQQVSVFWEIIDDVFNSMLFVLMGFSILLIDWEAIYLLAAVLAIFIVLFARFISVSIPYSLIRISEGRFSSKDFNDIAILTWSGLRGALAFALALSIVDMPYGHLFVFVTYVVAAFSIIVQGLTIGKLVKRLKV